MGTMQCFKKKQELVAGQSEAHSARKTRVSNEALFNY